MYVKNNKGLIAIIIILAILVIALGVYIFKGESIRQWVSKDLNFVFKFFVSITTF